MSVGSGPTAPIRRCPVILEQCSSSMLQTWLGPGRTAGGGIDREQPVRSSNEFVLRRERAAWPDPLWWSSKGLLVAA